MQNSTLSVQYILPDQGISFPDQIDSLFSKIKPLINDHFPVKLTFFTECPSSSDYHEKSLIIQQAKQINNIAAPVATICQLPAFGNDIVLEICSIQIAAYHFEISGENDYMILKNSETKVLFGSVPSYMYSSFKENVNASFKRLHHILEVNDFQFSNIIRQWNYIQDIYKQNSQNNRFSQNYQIFNNYRSINFDTCEFKNAYPVATGIGVNYGGCCIEVIAIKGKNLNIIPIQNSRQIDAHCYSNHVLTGKSVEKLEKNLNPKFERAKYFGSRSINMLLISGTASIIGEETVNIDDVEGQTITTIDNIELLVDKAKLINNAPYKILNYRAYVKNQLDCEKVKKICLKKWGNTQGIILLADICRENLLVEIECSYVFEKE
jgi:hypothetical protein